MKFELSSAPSQVIRRVIYPVAALIAFSLASGDAWAQGAGTVQFAASGYQVTENEGSVTISVMRVRGNSGAISVDYTVTPGTATPLTDYEGTNGILSWGDGDSGQKSFDIIIQNDFSIEEEETLFLTLTNPQGGSSIGTLKQTRVEINGDESGALGFTKRAFITSELDGRVEIMVTRGLGATGAILVDYEVLGGGNLSAQQIGGVTHSRRLPDGDEYPDTIQQKFVPGVKASVGDDFIANSGTLSFRDFEMSRTFQVRLLSDLAGPFPRVTVPRWRCPFSRQVND